MVACHCGGDSESVAERRPLPDGGGSAHFEVGCVSGSTRLLSSVMMIPQIRHKRVDVCSLCYLRMDGSDLNVISIDEFRGSP
jgi:hypothetical protein